MERWGQQSPEHQAVLERAKGMSQTDRINAQLALRPVSPGERVYLATLVRALVKRGVDDEATWKEAEPFLLELGESLASPHPQF